MNKLLICIICLLTLSCNFKRQNSALDNINKTDTIFYDRKLGLKKRNKIINTHFDSTKIALLSHDSLSKPFMQFSNNTTDDINSFLNKMFWINNSLDKVKYYNHTIELLFIQSDSVNFYKNAIGDSPSWVFNHYMYHDIYYSLFTFQEVDKIKIFIEYKRNNSLNSVYKKRITNITFLPLSGDYEILLPNGEMQRKWYTKHANYWDIFNNDLLDTPNTFIDDKLFEIKEEILDSVINEYKR